ncbi:MAG: hypothetical protein MOGMAGMI_01816 [Candidatus Omnitrophica bacterium]|nr:hypothetical protein [Ignavibacteriaceae bacterium]MCG3176852.1 hypothetical protein [Candidatus Omnitrophota bacterium]
MGSVGLFLFLALMGGLLEEHNGNNQPAPTPTTIPTTTPKPTVDKDIRLEFVRKCNEAGQSIPYCLCVHDYIVEYYSRDKLYELELSSKTEIIPDEFFDASIECRRFERK